MQFWAAFLSGLGVLIAVAGFLDKYYEDTGRASKWRSRLTQAYLWLEIHVPVISIRTIAVVALSAVTIGVVLGIIAIALILYSVFSVSPHDVNDNDGGLFFFPINWKVFFFGLCLIFAIAGILSAACIYIVAHPLLRNLVVHYLDKSSDPKVSPLAYTVAIIGIMVGVIKCIADIAKLLPS